MSIGAASPIATSENFAPHPSSGRSRAALFGTLWSMLHTLLPSLSAALIFYLSAAYLSPADFGRLAIAGGLVSVALAFSPLAFGEALIQRKSISSGHADAVFWLDVLVGVIYCAALVLVAHPAATWFGEPDLLWLLPLLALKVPFEMIAVVPNAMIVRSMRFRAIAIRTAIASGVGAVICIALLLSGYGLAALAISQVSVSATTCIVALWVARWWPGFSGQPRHLKELFQYTIFVAGDRMLSTLRLDHLVVGALGGSALLGLLTFAQRVFRILSDLASGALGSVTHVVLSSMQSEKEKAREAFLLVSFASACVGLPVFAGAAFIVDDLIGLLFDDRWADARAATQIFCLAGFLTTLGVVQGSLIRSQGCVKWWFHYQLLQQGTTVLTIALTYHMGVTAIAVAVVAKSFLFWPLSVRKTAKLLECPILEYLKSFSGPAFATAGMTLAIWMMPAEGWSGVLRMMAVGSAVYSVLLIVLCRERLTATFSRINSARRT